MKYITVSGLTAWQEEKVIEIGATVEYKTYKNIKTGEISRPAIIGFDEEIKSKLQEVVAIENIVII